MCIPANYHGPLILWVLQVYGDIMSMTLFGRQRVVVVSSEEAIREVLVNKQEHFSGKCCFHPNLGP